MVVSPLFQNQERQKVAFLAPPTMSPKLLLPSHAKGGTGARSRSGCQVLVDLNASLIVSDHATSAMPSPDSSMSHERIFPRQASTFFLDGGIRHLSKTRKDRRLHSWHPLP